MKTILITFIAILSVNLNAQVTYNPTSYSNVSEISIKKISITDYYTIVDFELYTTKNNYNFFFHRNMYIQKADQVYSKKYYVREFSDNQLHKKYSADPYTTYQLQLKFDKIPKGISYIQIIEPYTEGYTPWYWKRISINNPNSVSGSSMSSFFKYMGVKTLAGLAHPSNTFNSGSYEIYSDYVIIKINYEEGYNTKLRINKENGLFTKIIVLNDNDFPPPFLFVSVLKEIADEAMQNSADDTETKSKLERELGKAYYEFDGFDISLFILNLEWIDY